MPFYRVKFFISNIYQKLNLDLFMVEAKNNTEAFQKIDAIWMKLFEESFYCNLDEIEVSLKKRVGFSFDNDTLWIEETCPVKIITDENDPFISELKNNFL